MGTADATGHHRPWVTEPSISSGIFGTFTFSRKPAGARVRPAGGFRRKSFRDLPYPSPSGPGIRRCQSLLSGFQVQPDRIEEAAPLGVRLQLGAQAVDELHRTTDLHAHVMRRPPHDVQFPVHAFTRLSSIVALPFPCANVCSRPQRRIWATRFQP